jgi:hydroxymethylpyrimidine pyrophosphatase-like HAD family hydrolase
MSYLLLENYIKSIIEKNTIKELHVFDFDMTLYNHNKKDWFEDVMLNLKKSLKDPSVRVILCTAREKSENFILKTEKLLSTRKMSLEDFNECYFKSIHRKEKTPIYKSNVILDEVSSNTNIVKVKFWDDREDTLNQVKKDLKKYNENIIYIPVNPLKIA